MFSKHESSNYRKANIQMNKRATASSPAKPPRGSPKCLLQRDTATEGRKRDAAESPPSTCCLRVKEPSAAQNPHSPQNPAEPRRAPRPTHRPAAPRAAAAPASTLRTAPAGTCEGGRTTPGPPRRTAAAACRFPAPWPGGKTEHSHSRPSVPVPAMTSFSRGG